MDAISLTNVVKTYPGALALKGISFKVKKGHVHGFLGPNGAGKSTTMKILAGLITPTSGEIEILGESFPRALELTQARVGFLPEHPPVYSHMQVDDYLVFVARAHGVKRSDSSNALEKVLEQCGLGGVRRRLIGNLSKGFQQRVGIAQALIFRPEILILDEPTVGLDPKAVQEIRDLIFSLKGEQTVLFSSHLLNEVENLCSDITIINKGEVLKSGPLEEIRHSLQGQQVIETQLESWNKEIEKSLLENSSFQNVEKVNEGHYIFYSSSTEDQRSELSSFLVEKGCGLLEMREQKLELEDIFKQVTEVSRHE